MKKYYIISLIACFACIGLVSCNKDDAYSPALPGVKASVAIIPDVFSVESPVEVKSAGEYLGVKTLVSDSEDDGFSITEYASRIDDAIPATKGVEITGETTTGGFVGNFISQYGQFNVMSFLDTVNNTTKLRDNISEGPLSVKYTDGWKWNGADAPTWRTSTPTTFWSYAPVSALGSIGLTSVSGGSAGADTTTVLSFSHTVPTSLTDQKDILFAYNVETRHFQTDASGNYVKDAAGHFQLVDGEDQKFTVHFKHALSAVKFRLNSSSAGANVHSITLCYMDSDKNIVKNVGVAKYGDCTATGTGEGSGSLSFDWSNLGTYKPLRYTFSDTYSNPASPSTVAGGYTNTGEGVMFMIPQTLSRSITVDGKTANLKIIVEFSKYGSSQYYTVVKDFKVKRSGADSDITWNAGYYYLYELQIGEFHVPGEPLVGKASLDATNIKHNHGGVAYSSFIPIKGVERVGLILDGYSTKDNGPANFYLYPVFDDNTPSASTYNPPTPESFEYDFLPITLPTTGAVMTTIYEFGNGTTEAYSTAYSFNLYPTNSYTGLYHYVFQITPGASDFNIAFATNSSNNSGYFKGNVLGIMVLEVKEDPNIPNGWDSMDWSEYL